MGVIEHDPGLGPPAQDAVDLTDGSRGVWRVVQHSPRVDEIERFVREGQVLSIAD